jgi:hypothetical protein
MLRRVVLHAYHPHHRHHRSLAALRPAGPRKRRTAHEIQAQHHSTPQVENAVDVLYILDVVANSRTAYVEGGVVVLDSGRIFLRYRRRRRREPRAPLLRGSAARPAEMRARPMRRPFLFTPRQSPFDDARALWCPQRSGGKDC